MIRRLKVLQSDVRIDLLVTDVGLPGGMNGRQMADAARVGRPDLKVLFITGYAENAAVPSRPPDPARRRDRCFFTCDAVALEETGQAADSDPQAVFGQSGA